MTKRILTLLATLIVLATVYFVLRPALYYRSIPTANTTLTHFDTLIVLGTPCRPDDTPSPEQRERVLESVREYQRGIAPHIIMTGGPAHNRFVEAHCMKLLAISQGVLAEAILEEGRAQNTIQNIYFSNQIMVAHNWHSAEVISSPSHLPRAALILQHYTFAWHTHPAHWPPEYHFAEIALIYTHEIESCWHLHTHGFTTGTLFPPNSASLPQPI
jgi:uncharacterized SAM-binding protein YcdF (DUF218 family)